MTTALKVARRKLTATATAAINAPRNCNRLIGIRFGKDWQTEMFLGRIVIDIVIGEDWGGF